MQTAHRPPSHLLLLGLFAVVACSGAADESRPEEGTLPSQGEPAGGQAEGAPAESETEAEAADGGADADQDSDVAPPRKALAEDCGGDAECESGLCFVGGQSSYCSLPCTAENAEDVCVAPFDGRCNKQGRCRRPD